MVGGAETVKGAIVEAGFLIFFFFAVFVVTIRVFAGALDGERVEEYVRQNGWTLVDKSWDPFGPGWFGEKDSRIYQIVYRDQQGNLHKAHVKTSMFTGVYLTKDQIVQHSEVPPSPGEESLEAENRRLKERIRKLEAQQGQRN